MFRFVTTEVLWNGVCTGSSVVTLSDGELTVAPFEKELHSTIFIPGTVAVLRAGAVDEFLLDDIEMMVGQDGVLKDKKRLDDYLKSSSLYYESESGELPMFIKLGRPCQIIPIN